MFLAMINDLEDGEYLPLNQKRNAQMLVRTGNNFRLMSNVCPHQSSMLTNKQGKDLVTCPYHGWSFDTQGNPVNSGVTKCVNSKKLKTQDAYVWNGMIFTDPVEFPELDFLDLSKMQLMEKRVDRVNANYKKIMDLFLDVDHIPVAHPGVYDRVGITRTDGIEWTYYENASLQIVKENNQVKAAWLALYPGTMIEWQQESLFVTVCVPTEQDFTDVIVYKYMSNDNMWPVNEEVWETAWQQDRALAEMMISFANTNLEESKIHFREWLNR